MELRRGLLMIMAGQIKNLDNLFANVQMYPGYISGNGSTAAPGETTKEIYTDYIDTSKWSAGDQIYFLVKYPANNNSMWCSIGVFDENDSFLSRPTSSITTQSQIPVNDGYLLYGVIQIPLTAKKIKLSCRTYGGELFACKAQDFSDSIPFVESNQ